MTATLSTLVLTLGISATVVLQGVPSADVWIVTCAFAAPGLLVAALLPVFVDRFLGGRIARMSMLVDQATVSGAPAKPLDDRSGDDLASLGRAIDALAAHLTAQVNTLTAEKAALEGRLTECVQSFDQAMETARQSSAQKTRFLASMSHEIRTPIGAVLGYAELLDEGAEARDDCRQAVQAIRRNAQHLLELINDILDLSKIEAGSFEMERVDCSLNQIVKDVLSVMAARAQAKGLQLTEVYLTPVPERIISDPTRIRQVLINLVGNAVKFTEHGMVTVSLSFAQTGPNRGKLELRVQDTGMGIPADKINLLFQPFQQLDASVSRKFGGTGLGLAISKEIARLLDGNIVVRSEPGLGSLFTLTVTCDVPPGTPMHKRPSAAVMSEAAKKKVESGSRRGAPIVSGRVLVVDDGPDNRKLFRYHVEGAGAEVAMAENGEEAVQRAAAQAFDLVLMDIQMPRMDGYEALREIRALGVQTPVIALTAHAMKGDREKCLQAGFNDYLSKPVTRAALLEKLATFLPPPVEHAETTSPTGARSPRG